MSLAHLLSINGAIEHRYPAASRYHYINAKEFKRLLLKQPRQARSSLSEATAESQEGSGKKSATGHWRLSADAVKSGFLIGLLFLCTGAAGLNYLCSQKQVYTEGQVLRQQELQAERARWLHHWLRTQATVVQWQATKRIPPARLNKPYQTQANLDHRL